MRMRASTLALTSILVGAIGWAAASADLASDREASAENANAVGIEVPNPQISRTPMTSGYERQRPNSPIAETKRLDRPIESRAHASREENEREFRESRLSTEWDEMSSQQRSDGALIEFRRSLRAALDHRSTADLQHAAAMLSVLRSELYATDAGREEYDRLEAEYDYVELQLDTPQ